MCTPGNRQIQPPKLSHLAIRRSQSPQHQLQLGIYCVDGHQDSLNLINSFLEFLGKNSLSQIVDFPTRISNILDIFVTNRPSLIESCESIDGISDHEVVLTKSLILAQVCPSTRNVFIYCLKLTSITLDRLLNHSVMNLS